MNNETIWLAKLDARLHDPIEKALVLMRTGKSHEAGTSQTLRAEFGLDQADPSIRNAVRKADHWASAMDRAAFPNRNSDGQYPGWQQVRFHEQPVIIHPLTGQSFSLERLSEVDPGELEQQATRHLKRLVVPGDPRRTALAFWRFGSEIDAPDLRNLWALLPADTRVPDHTIFDHLDLCSALSGVFAADPSAGPSLLAVSLGPVQEFIAQARSTSDLWAGSHLLSRMTWEAMKVIVEEFGPEAVLFPRLRGIPLVDTWLQVDCGLDAGLFSDCEWRKSRTDSNPLFAAALPNRFTAVVPASRAGEIAERIRDRVRSWTRDQAKEAFRMILAATGIDDTDDLPAYAQIEQQLRDFPEVHWAAVPWSLAGKEDSTKIDSSIDAIAEAMQPFFESSPPGYLGSKAWSLLSNGITLEQGWFWKPNPGSLYPALHELLERSLAAVKSVRAFDALDQQGWRDSLSGEVEWLTTDRTHLSLPPGQRNETVWARLAERRRSWARPREHLGAANTLKRLWPSLFVREIQQTLGLDFDRFVVSTHTLAVAGSIHDALERNRELPEALRRELAPGGDSSRVALPRKLVKALRRHPDGQALSLLPGWLERLRESGTEAELQRGIGLLSRYLGQKPESYYGLLLMDGDRMGAWMSAERELTLEHRSSFHPQIRSVLDSSFKGDPHFLSYADEKRAANPARHMLISDALSNFALTLAPAVIEQHHHGRVLYAGGDDVMAMLPVRDLLEAMALLRAAYSGIEPAEAGLDEHSSPFVRQANGFVLHEQRLLRTMGQHATASCGAVVAHHQAPLGAVLRELRAAEHRAKNDGGRNAFSITVVKRSGGALHFTAKWGKSLHALLRLRDVLADPAMSRRAVYHTATWLRDLPEPEPGDELLASMLAWQLERQCRSKHVAAHLRVSELASALVGVTLEQAPAGGRRAWLENLLSIAEFLAREGRTDAMASEAVRTEALA